MEADDINLFPVSAKKNMGIDELKAAIITDCRTTVKDIIAYSAKLKMRDIVASALSQITLYRTALQLTHKEFDEKFSEIEEMFGEVQAEAAEFAEHFKSNPRMLEAHMNDIKNQLSAKVSELFGIEYHYNISTVDFFRGGQVAEDGSRDLRESFTTAVDDLCVEMKETLMAIFMHREENAYTVVRRVNDLNRLVHKLIKLRSELAE